MSWTVKNRVETVNNSVEILNICIGTDNSSVELVNNYVDIIVCEKILFSSVKTVINLV